ncbi:Ig-like domain-containing protein, partial [Leucobacter luti]|uniref:Ig-like domain-containing protein n=1 Tax=Leucobacter luti TaxID=340320 RepID=UPI001A7E0B8C
MSSATTAGIRLEVAVSGISVPSGKAGVYAALTPAGTTATIGSGAFLPTVALPGGAGTLAYDVPAGSLDPAQAYEAIVWYAHGNPEADVIVAQVPVQISAEQWDAVFPPAQPTATATTLSASAATAVEGDEVTLTAQVAPAAAGTVTFTEGESQLGSAAAAEAGATLTLSDLAIGSHTIAATFAPDDAVAFAGSSSQPVEIVVTAQEEPPTGVSGSASVSAADASGVTVEASVSGVDPASQPAGVHVGV